MSPTVDRPEPPYLQIVKRIREQIRSGELRDGDMVPSTRKLAAEWNVSWPTAAKALTMLQSEGLVRGVAGVGTVVCAGVTAHNSSIDRLRSIWRQAGSTRQTSAPQSSQPASFPHHRRSPTRWAWCPGSTSSAGTASPTGMTCQSRHRSPGLTASSPRSRPAFWRPSA